MWRLPLLAYDFLTYHCNFAYTPNLYFPLKANIVTLPFTLLCVAGIIAFVRTRREHLALAGFAVILIGLAIALKAMPFGGVRHSLTLAPFVWILSGYGIQALDGMMAHVKASRNLRRLMVGTLAFIALLTFACSGSYLYKARTATINLPLLASLAEHYQVRTIAGFEDARDILAVMDYTAGHILRDRNLQFQLFDKNPYYNSNVMPVSPEKIGTTLVVAYRAPLRFDLPQVNATIVWEDFGPALAYPTVNQSIYYPPNGFFVYLLTEKQE